MENKKLFISEIDYSTVLLFKTFFLNQYVVQSLSLKKKMILISDFIYLYFGFTSNLEFNLILP